MTGPAGEPVTVLAYDTPKRPALWPAFVVPLVALAAAGVVQAVVFFVLARRFHMLSARPGPNEIGPALRELSRHPVGFAALSGSLELVAAAVAWIAASFDPAGPRARLGLLRARLARSSWPLALLATAGFILGGVAFMALLQGAHALPEIGAERRALAEAFRVHDPRPMARLALSLMLLVAGALLPALGEELMFRGYVQRRLLERWRPPWAIGVTSALFALGHGDIAYAAFTLPVGLWLGYLAWRTGSIVPGIAAHAFVNGVFQTGLLAGAAAGPTPSFAAFLVGAFAVCAACALAVTRRLERAARNAPSTGSAGGA